MTLVGHSLLGATLAAAALPRSVRLAHGMLIGATIGLLANAPDLPIPGWGHDEYRVSHSATIAAAVGLVSGLAAAIATRRVLPGPAHLGVGIAVGVAWPSHLLLDALYAHGRGVDVGWPFGTVALALPLPWFETLRLSPLDLAHDASVLAIEALVYGGVLVAVWRWRRP